MRDMIRINLPWIGKDEIDSVVEVLKSGVLTDKSGMGPKVLEFEKNFASFVGARHAVAMSSGTAALHGALLAAGIRRDDEVVIPSFSFVATAGAVMLAGGRPVFADIHENSYCITAETIESAVTQRTKAIIPVHLYGLPADLDPIVELARERDICIIEDAAHAHGAAYKGRKIGSIGDITCFSCYAGKNLTTGEGGIAVTNNDELAESLRQIRTHGEERPYWVTRLGHNYHMTELAAAIGIAQLKKLPFFLERRRKNAQYFNNSFETLGKITTPKGSLENEHAWYLYTLRLRGANAGKRNKVVNRLRAKNIEASAYYDSPIHTLPFYRGMQASKPSSLAETERAARQVFSIPTHPRLSESELQYIVDNLKRALR